MNSKPVFMLIAGEASGDQYGARVIKAIRARKPESSFFGIGGDRMKEAGMELLFHISQTSIMGFVEVAKNYRFLRNVFRRCKSELRTRHPLVLILVDYPGFNLRFARTIRSERTRIVYYISPQVWAWGKERANKMKPLVDHLAVVFPFEQEIYEPIGVPTTFVGHPLLEILRETDRTAFLDTHSIPDQKILALLPGSRLQEIERILPVILKSAIEIRKRTGCTICIGAAHLPDEIYTRHLQGIADMHVIRNATHQLMEHAHAAIVASGTATVETAFYTTPMVIVYRTSTLNYEIGKRLITVNNIGMPNILAGRRIVPELIQGDVTVENIVREALPYFENESRHTQTVSLLRSVKAMMGEKGASEKVAEIVLNEMTIAQAGEVIPV